MEQFKLYDYVFIFFRLETGADVLQKVHRMQITHKNKLFHFHLNFKKIILLLKLVND